MSLSSQVMEYITTQPADRLQSMTPSDIATALNSNNQRVSKTLWSLDNSGRIALRRSGHAITGIESVIRPVPSRKPSRYHAADGSPEPTGATQSRPSKTPALDAYKAAKRLAESLHDGAAEREYLDINFRESPLAEEGLQLREQLHHLQHQYSELSTKYKMVLYEYEGVKQRIRERAYEKVAKAKTEAFTDAN